ncbi:SDR family NAD(P)-dependent oxidoreductase [Aegicerativicinus sediminis]
MSKNVIITGTSRGIGFELVKLFAKNGDNVLALSRNELPIKNLELKTVFSESCDITTSDGVKSISNFVRGRWGKVDILINNAGFLINRPFIEISIEDFRKVYDVNVFAVAETIKAVLPFMGNLAHVVSISSMGGIQGSAKFPGLAAYSSSKGAVITLSELLAEEYKDSGPSFNVLALGAVQTEMLEQAFPGYKAPTTAAEMAQYIFEFACNGQKYYNGKVLQVSNSTP